MEFGIAKTWSALLSKLGGLLMKNFNKTGVYSNHKYA